ncbi:CRISPR system Cms endoribonuclease Csm3 [Methanosarcinales archaeon]|nr:type III-B CRISPR module RAMP protein Cmr4 [Candidatus Methanoperedens sp.]CAG0995756.1 CRISPR system Cms endoribonuclease Csm3 [Methanosarcinales archaeon]
MNMNNSFSTLCYLIQTIDPVHIGTGGMRLGRVDNSIVREPGTRLPKIPGTSLSGAIRSYSAYRYGKRRCSGQKDHCGSPSCPICYTFGSITGEGEKQKSFSGVVSIGDARILFFPVYSMAGPVWVTSPSTLADFGISENVSNDKARMASGLKEFKNLNLGWLMVEKENDLAIEGIPADLPSTVKDRIVLVSDKLFSQIVNSNLEVRTSVSIDPKTGAAADKALFTYEAIPRAAFLWMDLIVDDYRYGELWQNDGVVLKYKEEQNKTNNDTQKNEPLYPDPKQPEQPLMENNRPKGWRSPADVVTAGIEWAEHLGIGGMGTRGFGRIRGFKL